MCDVGCWWGLRRFLADESVDILALGLLGHCP
jgi:hypothetical protein